MDWTDKSLQWINDFMSYKVIFDSFLTSKKREYKEFQKYGIKNPDKQNNNYIGDHLIIHHSDIDCVK